MKREKINDKWYPQIYIYDYCPLHEVRCESNRPQEGATYIQEEDRQLEGDITWKAVKTPRSWGYIWFLPTEM